MTKSGVPMSHVTVKNILGRPMKPEADVIMKARRQLAALADSTAWPARQGAGHPPGACPSWGVGAAMRGPPESPLSTIW